MSEACSKQGQLKQISQSWPILVFHHPQGGDREGKKLILHLNIVSWIPFCAFCLVTLTWIHKTEIKTWKLQAEFGDTVIMYFYLTLFDVMFVSKFAATSRSN